MESPFIIESFVCRVVRYRESALQSSRAECHYFRRCSAIVMADFAKRLEAKALVGQANAIQLAEQLAAITEREISYIDPNWRKDAETIHRILSSVHFDPNLSP